MRKTDPAKQQAKRRQILDAAIVCFAKGGFHGTSTAQICAQAGMSPGNLFHYFPSKLAIIQAIAELDREETTQALSRLSAAENVVVGLQELGRDVLLAASEPAYGAIRIEIAAEATRNAAVSALFATNDQLTRAALMTELARGIDNGQIDPGLDLFQTAAWLIALLEGGVGRAALDPCFNLAANQAALSDIIARLLVVRT
jgi:TetR/AcrR family transcriptional regulator, repressor for uid operon